MAGVARSHFSTTREPDAVVLRFRDYPGVYEQLRRLVAADRDCCPFLVFDGTREDGPVVVRITATPESDVDVASELDRLIPLLAPPGSGSLATEMTYRVRAGSASAAGSCQRELIPSLR
jgi:hypothetical protein